jgi:hypothetical protein
MRLRASVTADLAESIEAVVTAAMVPVKAALITEPTTSPSQIQFIAGSGEAQHQYVN